MDIEDVLSMGMIQCKHLSMLAQKNIVKSIVAGRIVWRRHSLERMLKRDISRHDVLKVLRTGEQIEDYPPDFPLPVMVLGDSAGGRRTEKAGELMPGTDF